MNEKLDSCTCPSGDGSLRHPCPAHPATLATAKHGGCVQLPTSERERFEAWAEGNNYEMEWTGLRYVEEATQDAWLAWQAAISAQPSPGGQGDALAMIGDNLRSMRLLAEKIAVTQDGSVHLANIKNEIQHALQLLGTTLAARQPVGEPVAYVEFLDRQNDSLRRAIHAIMAKLAFLLDEDQFADVDAIALAAGVAPPAQAVDLGQFREPVECWIRALNTIANDSAEDEGERHAARVLIAHGDHLLALIDSQAVGNG